MCDVCDVCDVCNVCDVCDGAAVITTCRYLVFAGEQNGLGLVVEGDDGATPSGEDVKPDDREEGTWAR